MDVRFWGTRGSLAKPGPTTLRYGGNTSCVEVRCDDGTLIVLDCGTGAHALGQSLLADGSSTSQAATLTPRSRWHGARMTLDEFLALPEEKPYLEYDNGVVLQKDVSSDVAPQGDHGSIQAEFVIRFDQAGRQRRLGKVFSETRFVTPGWAPVPDVSYYRREHIRPASRHQIGDLQIPPDIAVEIARLRPPNTWKR